MNQVVTNIFHKLLLTSEAKKYKSGNFYSLGIIIEFNGRTIQLASRINEYLKLYKSELERLTDKEKELCELICSGYFSEVLLDDMISNKKFPVYNLLEDEKYVIRKVIGMKDKQFLAEMTARSLEKDYQKYTLDIIDVFDRHIKSAYIKEIRELFHYTADKAKEKELFRLVDFLIHFINWNNSFYDFYDTSFDIIPGHIRKVENRLSHALRLTIKAYLAFHSHINTLRRLLEKHEQGRISTLSLLDWQTDIKNILTKQFVTLFGRKKSAEYIQALQKLVQQEFKI
ncbi:MAG: hypothetical protein JW723_08070 [Bacteroidales bacterium]|nr:hypothetical protein [Bacteroidales bacterium]